MAYAGTGVAERLLEERRHRDRVLARGEPHRERGPRLGLDRRLVERRVPRRHRVHGDRRFAPRCARRTRRRRAASEGVTPPRLSSSAPGASVDQPSRSDLATGAMPSEKPAGRSMTAASSAVQVVDRVRGDTAVEPRVQLARSRRQPHLRPGEAAQAGRDRRQVGVDHAAVEDDRGREVALHVSGEVVHDRVAADLLLAVGEHAHVHPEVAGRREVERRPEERVEVALVVACPAGVEMAVAHLGLERRARPQVERPRRLNVVVAVGDDRRRTGPGGLDRAVDDGVAIRLGDPGAADQPGDPLGRLAQLGRVRAVARDRLDPEELAKLGERSVSGRDAGCACHGRCRSA